MKTWEQLGEKATTNPVSTLKIIVLLIFLFVPTFWIIGNVFNWFGNAAQVVHQEFSPQAMLKKYEWFKNAASELDKKQADIAIYQNRFSMFEGIERKDMDRTDKEQLMLWTQELAGVKASYNGLAAEWNAQISKFNWKPFLGDLPEGATKLLTKEYAPYETY